MTSCDAIVSPLPPPPRRYTFGKPLINANVSINATARGIGSWQYNNNQDLVRNISDFQASDKEGCAVFDLVVSKLGIGLRNIGGGNSVSWSGERGFNVNAQCVAREVLIVEWTNE